MESFQSYFGTGQWQKQRASLVCETQKPELEKYQSYTLRSVQSLFLELSVMSHDLHHSCPCFPSNETFIWKLLDRHKFDLVSVVEPSGINSEARLCFRDQEWVDRKYPEKQGTWSGDTRLALRRKIMWYDRNRRGAELVWLTEMISDHCASNMMLSAAFGLAGVELLASC